MNDSPCPTVAKQCVVPPGVEVRTADQADFFVSKAALDMVVREYEQEDTERFVSLGRRFVFAGAEGVRCMRLYAGGLAGFA